MVTALKSVKWVGSKVDAESLLRVSSLLPDLITGLEECSAQFRRNDGGIKRLNARVAALSLELARQRAGRAPSLRQLNIGTGASPLLAGYEGKRPQLPYGVRLKDRKTISDNTLALTFELEDTSALRFEAFRTDTQVFLKTRSDTVRSEPGWRSGTDRFGPFFLCYREDLGDGSDRIAKLARYCFSCLDDH